MRAQPSGHAIFVDSERFRPAETRRPPSMALAAALVGACVALWHIFPAAAPPDPPAAGAEVSDIWSPAALPPLIEIPALGRTASAQRFGAAIQSSTGVRRDTYALGELGVDETVARVEAWIGPARERDTLFVELAEQASRFEAAISKFTVVKPLQTTRGVASYADMVISDGVALRSCVGFRMASSDLAGVRGIICPAEPDKFPESRLTCLIEGVASTPEGAEGGMDAALRGPPRTPSGGDC